MSNSQGRKGLTLFFTLGVSLSDWDRAGFLKREVTYYQYLSEHIGPITFITYGGDEDLDLAAGLDHIRVLNNPEGLSSYEFMRRSPSLYRETVSDVAVVKSNQIKGAQAVIRLASMVGAKAIVRGGYLLSRFLSNRPLTPRAKFGLWRRELALFHRADRVFLPTGDDLQYARQHYWLPHKRGVVVPNFVDTDLFRPRDEVTCEPGLICFVGRLAPQKNLLALIDAMADIPDTRLRIIGDGSEREAIIQRAAERNVNIEMLGRIPHEDLPRLLAECEIFVLPSLYEGLPKALLEAMSAGLPVVATKVQGNETLIRHMETGWLCEDTSAESLRNGLDTMLRNSAVRHRMGENAREFVIDLFSLKNVIAHEVAAYRDMGLL